MKNERNERSHIIYRGSDFTGEKRKLQNKLTSDELSWLDTIFTQVHEELHESVSKLGSVPLQWALSDMDRQAVEEHTERTRGIIYKRAHAEDFIALEGAGRVRLSKETRKAELKRLKRKYKKRKKYTFRYGRKHNKLIARTRKEYNNKRWERDPLSRLKYTFRKPVHITPEEWAEYIAPVWDRYDRKYLKLKCNEPKMTVFSLIIEYHEPREKYARKTPHPVVVYDGYTEAVHRALRGPEAKPHSEAVHSTMKKLAL